MAHAREQGLAKAGAEGREEKFEPIRLKEVPYSNRLKVQIIATDSFRQQGRQVHLMDALQRARNQTPHRNRWPTHFFPASRKPGATFIATVTSKSHAPFMKFPLN